MDVEHLAGCTRRLEIVAAVVSQAEIEALVGYRPPHRVGMPLELVADRRADKVGPVRVEPLLHHQVDLAEVDVAEIDRDLLGVGRISYHLMDVACLWSRPSISRPCGSYFEESRVR